jgi:hypothetical protein
VILVRPFSPIPIVGAALLLLCLQLAPGHAEDTAEKAFLESRQRFDRKTHIKVSYEVSLSPEMKGALKKYNPYFEIWKSEDYLPTLIQVYEFKAFPRKGYFAYQTPSAVIGDFNGDFVPDVIMKGHDKKSSLMVAIMSHQKEYRVIELGKGPLKDPREEWYDVYGGNEGVEYGFYSFLTLVEPGKIKANSDLNRPEIDLKADAVIMGVFEKYSDMLVYNDDNKFVSYRMGD